MVNMRALSRLIPVTRMRAGRSTRAAARVFTTLRGKLMDGKYKEYVSYDGMKMLVSTDLLKKAEEVKLGSVWVEEPTPSGEGRQQTKRSSVFLLGQ